MKSWTNKPICLDTEGAQLRTSLLSKEIIAKEHEIIEFVPKENLKKKSAEELSKVTGGLNLPLDFKLPF